MALKGSLRLPEGHGSLDVLPHGTQGAILMASFATVRQGHGTGEEPENEELRAAKKGGE